MTGFPDVHMAFIMQENGTLDTEVGRPERLEAGDCDRQEYL